MILAFAVRAGLADSRVSPRREIVGEEVDTLPHSMARRKSGPFSSGEKVRMRVLQQSSDAR